VHFGSHSVFTVIRYIYINYNYLQFGRPLADPAEYPLRFNDATVRRGGLWGGGLSKIGTSSTTRPQHAVTGADAVLRRLGAPNSFQTPNVPVVFRSGCGSYYSGFFAVERSCDLRPCHNYPLRTRLSLTSSRTSPTTLILSFIFHLSTDT
jgi:hypothetical protein